MILGPISLIDCAVFCIFLTPQLIIQVGLIQTILTVLPTLPFLLLTLPYEITTGRYLTPRRFQSSFVKNASFFEDLVIRCVRYAFANIPADVGRVFFCKWVALPFARWRMLRHGHLRYPSHVQEIEIGEDEGRTKGIWIMHDTIERPDIVVYYIHGGGFAMGSSYFYLEFLMAFHQLLRDAGYRNPAIFALEYTLVPDDVYPRQVNQSLQGYRHILEVVGSDASRICVGGDSAGGTLVLSLLLELGAQKGNQQKRGVHASVQGGLATTALPALALPHMAILISPWVTLMSNKHYPSTVDFLDRDVLWRYAHEYAGSKHIQQVPASPGSCMDDELWYAARPTRGYFVAFGDQEVFAADALHFVQNQRRLGVEVSSQKSIGSVHAWPVASLFLSSTEEKRLFGLRTIVSEIRKRSVAEVNGFKTDEGE